MRRWSFTKGHGTENDFVLVLDREAMLELGPAEVRFLCDRRAGIGGDGLLRAVLAKHIDGLAGRWIPVVHGLPQRRRVTGRDVRQRSPRIRPVPGRRGPGQRSGGAHRDPVGLRETTLLPDGQVRVAMGPVVVTEAGVLVTPAGREPLPALTVDAGNPHAVSFVDDLDQLSLALPPRWEPEDAFPQGVNVEFVCWLGPRHLKLRVYERGVGETRSCGTGAVAAAAAAHDGTGPRQSPGDLSGRRTGRHVVGGADRGRGVPDRPGGAGRSRRSGSSGGRVLIERSRQMAVLDAFSLSGKVSVVTGAARGIGRALSQALAEAGSDVVLLVRDRGLRRPR